MTAKIPGSLVIGLVVWSLSAVAGAPAAGAQSWTFSATGAWVEQNADGSAGSFRTQLNLDEGFLLEDFELAFDAPEGESGDFDLRAWGFGSAEPSQGADLRWRPGKDWHLELGYRRTESFFELAGTELGLRRDDWQISRFRSKLTWNGWDAARLSLALAYVERAGVITQPFREFNEIWLLGADLDETRQDATFRLETLKSPVKVIFEQSFGELERRNDWFSVSASNLDAASDAGDSDQVFLDAGNSRVEERDVPISRLAATYRNKRFEVTGAFLYSPTELDVTGETSVTFGVDGGRLGRVQFADDLLGSGSFDALVGHFDVGILLGPQWTLRLTSDYRDRSQDATLLGNRLLRLSNDQGDFTEIADPLNEATLFDVTDATTSAEIEYQRDDWTLWVGAFDTRREVDYRIDGDFSVKRDSDGVLAGLSLHLGRRLKASVEYEHGSFERNVFRTDPETVDRFTAKLKTDLGKGWNLNLRGRFEEADESASTSPLGRSSDAYGAGLYWSSADGKKDCAFDLDQVDLMTETGLLLPDGSLSLSVYDLSLVSFGTHGRAQLGKLTLSGGLQWLEDDGETWPVTTWNARARIAFATTGSTEVAIYGQYWSYDEDLAASDDFDVTRYGVAFAWRYE